MKKSIIQERICRFLGNIQADIDRYTALAEYMVEAEKRLSKGNIPSALGALYAAETFLCRVKSHIPFGVNKLEFVMEAIKQLEAGQSTESSYAFIGYLKNKNFYQCTESGDVKHYEVSGRCEAGSSDDPKYKQHGMSAWRDNYTGQDIMRCYRCGYTTKRISE